MRFQLAKIGTVGLFITAITSPCCFPLFGFVLTTLGIGSFELFGAWSMTIFLTLTLLSLAGLFISYRLHKCMYSLIIALPSAILIFYSYFFMDASYWLNILYVGMLGMLVASGVDYYRIRLHKKRKKMELQSMITCPVCGHKKQEMMPTDACLYFYECEDCKTRLKPQEGDCCVFCSYGTVKCPPVQLDGACCTK